MSSREEVTDGVHKIILGVTRVHNVTITRDSSARDIPGWDSLAHVSIIASVEQLFGHRFTLKELKSLKTVGQLVDLVCSKRGLP